MPIFIKAHMRSGKVVRAYRRNTSTVRKAENLKWALSSITARGLALSKPQRKAFYKAGNVIAKHERLQRDRRLARYLSRY